MHSQSALRTPGGPDLSAHQHKSSQSERANKKRPAVVTGSSITHRTGYFKGLTRRLTTKQPQLSLGHSRTTCSLQTSMRTCGYCWLSARHVHVHLGVEFICAPPPEALSTGRLKNGMSKSTLEEYHATGRTDFYTPSSGI
ncbi:unnamed protein product [Protopolystoma xenopodis]|uniref:Uncharacterized protein n=1 Tax=Protopolystoma xenopodis TaxID=117903 RepID=A0A448WZR2_9PLAT|nr:unnamed protein product [Protopolystoma xenopodis]